MSPEKPNLTLFCDLSETGSLAPGIASALQSFETSIYCIAMHRWPATTGLVWQAIELFLQNAYGSGSNRELMHMHLKDKKVSKDLHESADRLRRTRNEFVHSGYSPRDDEKSVQLFFEAGVPYLNSLVVNELGKEIYEFNGTGQGADWFWDIYRATRKIIHKRKASNSSSTMAGVKFFARACTKVVKTNGRFESFLHPYEPYEHFLAEMYYGTYLDIGCAIVQTFLKDAFSGSGDEVVWINKLDCPFCDAGLMGQCEWGGNKNEDFMSLISVGCARCDYLITDKDATSILFGAKLSDQQKVKMHFQSTVLVKDAPDFHSGAY